MRPTRAVAAVWAMFAAVLVAVVITYTRLPPDELYHVDGHGFVGGGLSRAVVYLNFPVGLAGVYLLLAQADRMSRRLRGLAVAAFLLWMPVFSSRVLSQDYLDARWANGVPAFAVALMLVVTLATPARIPERLRGDRARIAVAGAFLVLALPWLAAELGFDFTGVPLLGQVFQTHELRRQPGIPELHPAVHYGDHHGLEATLLLLVALAVSRMLGTIRGSRLRHTFGLLTGVLIAYSVMNVANDAWIEQIVKRGWTNWLVPDVLEPRLNWGWLVIVGAGVALWLTLVRPQLTQTGVDSRARP